MIDNSQLCKFLVKAKKSTYASGDESIKIVEDNKSTTLQFIDGDWKYHDNYFGGEPYGGREVVFYKNKPIYIMIYYGWVNKLAEDINIIYKTLQLALLNIPENKPFRGPKGFKNNNMVYKNKYKGEIDRFFGKETISQDDKMLYEAYYIGGLVDQTR